MSEGVNRRWLIFARAAWVVVAVVALGRFVISVPARYDHLAHPTAGVRDALAELGLSADGYALYNVALDAVFVSGLPWRRVCQADHKDNNANGRTNELGERCWIDPVE